MRILNLNREEDKTQLETYIIQKIREKLKARMIYPVKQLDAVGTQVYMNGDTEIKIPVINKEFTYKPDTFEKDVEELTDAIAELEDRLLFSGETVDWKALGIEGLSTATGRGRMSASGAWSCASNLIADVLAAKELLGSKYPVLIIPWGMNRALHETYWYPDSLDKEPLTIKNYLLKEEVVSGIISTKSLYCDDGGIDSALLVDCGIENFYAVQGLPVEIQAWKLKDEWHVTVRETIAPVIKNPQSIVEISIIYTVSS